MSKPVIPEQGDIIHLNFSPSIGEEMRRKRYALVVSSKAFNCQRRLAMVCPISQGESKKAREGGYLITLMGSGYRLSGMIHVDQLRAIDFAKRSNSLKREEKVTQETLDEVLLKLKEIFNEEE